MRIGINAQSMYGDLSGVHYCILDLIEALAHADTTNEYVIYVNRTFDIDKLSTADHVNHRKSRFPNQFRLVRIAWEQTMLPSILQKDGIDLLHSPAYVAPLFATIPVVVTIPDVIAFLHPKLCRFANRVHFRLFLPAVAKRARRIITVSETSKRDIMRVLSVSGDRIDVVANGVHSQFTMSISPAILQDVRRTYSLPDHYLLYVGNIEPKKNLERVIEAHSLLRNRYGVRRDLVIVGRKAWLCADVFKKVRELGTEQSVSFTGYVPRDHLPSLYNLADAFLFPSLYEGFGIPPLEAMACGTPVVASNTPALKEVTAGAALLVDPLSAEAIAAETNRILTEPELREDVVQKGIECAKLYSWERAARETVIVYEKASSSSQ